MKISRIRQVSVWSYAALASLAFWSLGTLTTSCKHVEELLETGPVEPKKPLTCVSDLSAARDAKFDLAGDLATKMRVVTEGTVHLREVVEKLDKDVAHACAAIGRDLGKKALEVDEGLAPGERALSVCSAAAARVKSNREENGIVFLIYPQVPMCTTSLSEHSRCLRECDSNLPPDGSGTRCDPDSVSGRCDAKCTGTCVASHSDECSGHCRGVCRGGCDEEFHGKCGGRCNGTCDGNSSSGTCDGVCEGKCSKDANGSCGGTCKGKCAGACLSDSKKRQCSGICNGTCSEPLTAERCGGVLAPPEMVPECGALCSAQMSKQVNCLAGNVDIQVYNSTTEGAGDKLKAALAKGAAVLLEADEGMRPSLERASGGLQSAFESAEDAFDSNESAKKRAEKCLRTAKDDFEAARKALEKVREASQAVFFAAKG